MSLPNFSCACGTGEILAFFVQDGGPKKMIFLVQHGRAGEKLSVFVQHGGPKKN